MRPESRAAFAHDAGDLRAGLLEQATRARLLAAPFTARVLESCYRQLDAAPLLARRIDHWQGDFAGDAVALRLAAGLHALGQHHAPPRLGALYAALDGDFDSAIGEALAAYEPFLLDWISGPTQTNETARSAAFMAGLMAASQQDNLPVELLEIGTSAGLNLNMARYRYDLAGLACGDPASPLRIAPAWNGPPPPYAAIVVAQARGVDLHPINLGDPFCQERMTAYVWADQPERALRLKRAMAIALQNPPAIESGSALPWLRQHLATPQAHGIRRVVFNSMVLQYLAPDDRRDLHDAIHRAGAQADASGPLVWLSLEWEASRSKVSLRMTCWPSAEPQSVELAICTPYCDHIHWQPVP